MSVSARQTRPPRSKIPLLAVALLYPDEPIFAPIHLCGVGDNAIDHFHAQSTTRKKPGCLGVVRRELADVHARPGRSRKSNARVGNRSPVRSAHPGTTDIRLV